MGGVVPGGFSADEAEHLRERSRALAPGAVPPGRARARDVEPDLRQRSLRRRSCSRTCRRSAPSSSSASGCSPRPSSATAPARCSARWPTSATRRPSASALALEAIPDGEWEGEDATDCDGVDDTEEYRVHVRVVKRGGRAEVDFSGTSRQARTCINCTALDVKTTVGSPSSTCSTRAAGSRRDGPLHRPRRPRGHVVSALPPDGAVFAYWEQSQTMHRRRSCAPSRRRWATPRWQATAAARTSTTRTACCRTERPGSRSAQCGGEVGPFGANRHGDADSQMLSYQANGIGVAAEAIESDAPVVVLRHEIVADTAGAGLQPGRERGGPRTRCGLSPPSTTSCRCATSGRAASASTGGGRRDARRDLALGASRRGDFDGVHVDRPCLLPRRRPGRGCSRSRDERALAPTASTCTPYREPSWHTAPMARLRYLTNGGGGFGDPLEREPGAREARRARRLRDDRGRRAGLRRRGRQVTPKTTPRTSPSTSRRPSGCVPHGGAS